MEAGIQWSALRESHLFGTRSHMPTYKTPLQQKPDVATHRPAAHAARQTCLQCSEEGQRLKDSLRKALSSVKTCGLYGVQAAELKSIKETIKRLEVENPLHNPTDHLDLLAGRWNVLFTTIKVTGSRRVKLGLRDLVNISYLRQEVDASSSDASNRVGFRVPAFGIKNGELLLKASFAVASKNRVDIKLEQASLVPEKLQSIFEANFDLLLSIFNPEGYLDITYCDEELRCGRDDKGHYFVLERTDALSSD